MRRHLKLAAWFALDTLVAVTPAKRHAKRTLIVRLDRIGDLLLWLDAAQRVASFYRRQGQEVILAGNSIWADWAASLGIFDRVVSIDVARFECDLRYRWATAVQVRRLGCATAVSPAYSRSWGAGDCLVRVCGAAQRIGSQGDPSTGTAIERTLSRRWYTRLIPAAAVAMMELARNAEFVTGLTGEPFPARVADLRSISPAVPLAEIDPGLSDAGPFYVLFPGASAPGKCWPVERFREVAIAIHCETGWIGVVCGGPGDRLTAERLCAGDAVPLIDCAGRTSLAELTAVIAAARLVVANDTSAVHIAAAVAVPAICVLGGGHVGRFLPYVTDTPASESLPIVATHPMDCFGCNWDCIFPVPAADPKPCIAGVTFASVWQRVQAVIAAAEAVRRMR